MGREIAGGPAAVRATLEWLAANGKPARSIIGAARAVRLVGTGASFAIARCAEPLLRDANCASGAVRDLEACEASEMIMSGRPALSAADCVVAISKTGRSPEVLGACRRAIDAGCPVVAVTSCQTSELTRLATAVVPVPIGEEHGAATRSALGGLAAILGLWGLVEPTAALDDVLRTAVTDWGSGRPVGRRLAAARRTWFVGFGAAFGLAQAAALLWHEKAGRLAMPESPSAFRHGLIEAAGAEDVVVELEVEEGRPVRDAYMGLLSRECRRIGLRECRLSGRPTVAQGLALRGADGPARVLEGLIRVQQLARGVALEAGTYRDGFRWLAGAVKTTTPFE
jgi:fructoselysine-6-P-deglycase FrlB-like protein